MSEEAFSPADEALLESDDFDLWMGKKMVPNDITTTPPAVARVYSGNEDRERDFIIHIDYPEMVDDTLVMAEDLNAGRFSVIFNRFMKNVADEEGYQLEDLIEVGGELEKIPETTITEEEIEAAAESSD